MALQLNLSSNNPWFLHICSTCPLKTLGEKERLLIRSNFSFSHSVFYLFGELFAIFIKFEIDVCKVFQLGRAQNLKFGKGLKFKRARFCEKGALCIRKVNLHCSSCTKSNYFALCHFSACVTHSHTMTPFDIPGKQAF